MFSDKATAFRMPILVTTITSPLQGRLILVVTPLLQRALPPAEIDVAELYDCFTITIIVELEDIGFCPKGEGGRFVQDGNISIGGRIPVTTHGGLLSAGHPGLAGGMFHVVEAVRQIRGEAGERQVKDVELALAHGNGGIIGLHCTLILGRT